MKLSAPVFQLKRRAKLMARAGNMPLNEALDQIAREEGFTRWSLLSARVAEGSLSETVLAGLDNGDLLLIAARPGQGKTVLGLQLLLDAARAGRRAVFFTLDFTEPQARHHLRALDTSPLDVAGKIEVVTTEAIGAELILHHMGGSAPGTVAVIDYLQILDQQRSKPALSEQVGSLNSFASNTGVILGFISQIDRTFDPHVKRLPDIGDIRLPNPVDLRLFSKACFLHDGEAQFRSVA